MAKKIKKETARAVIATNVGQAVGTLKKKSGPLFKIVQSATIRTKEDQTKMVKALAKLKEYKEEAESERANFVDPANAIIAQAKSLFKPFLDDVAEANALGKQKILAFVNKRLLQAENVSSDFEAGKIKSVSTAVTRKAELEDNSNTRKVWKLKITAPNKIPRRYLVPDETAIRDALKKGKKVPGCKLGQETTIAI